MLPSNRMVQCQERSFTASPVVSFISQKHQTVCLFLQNKFKGVTQNKQMHTAMRSDGISLCGGVQLWFLCVQIVVCKGQYHFYYRLTLIFFLMYFRCKYKQILLEYIVQKHYFTLLQYFRISHFILCYLKLFSQCICRIKGLKGLN